MGFLFSFSVQRATSLSKDLWWQIRSDPTDMAVTDRKPEGPTQQVDSGQADNEIHKVTRIEGTRTHDAHPMRLIQ